MNLSNQAACTRSSRPT